MATATSNTFNITISDTTAAEADFTLRTSQPGVVWYHSFDSAAEVDAFRWTAAYGNDPDAVGNARSPLCSWVSSGGADGGGYMQIKRLAGTTESSDWWRPFSPLTGASNGRGVDDPGANGTLTPQVMIATDGGSETNDYAATAKPGWYGHSSYQNSFFDGEEFYLQVRVQTDPRQMSAGNYQGSKKVWFTTTTSTYTAQEIVTHQAYYGGFSGDGTGIPNYHHGYFGWNFQPWGDAALEGSGTIIQIGSDLGATCDPFNSNVNDCWSYSTGWDTLLYKITPGRDAVAEGKLEVWVAQPGENEYTKIWDITYAPHFEPGGNYRNGWNGFLCSTYANGFQGTPKTEFWERFDQLIFSKQFIAPPVTQPSWFVSQTESTWQAVGNTLDDINPCPADNCSYSGVSGQAGKVIAWCGAVASPTSLIIGPQGGHTAYDGNEVTEFDFLSETPAWSQLIAPSPVNGITSAYYPDGTPAARHGYQQDCFIPAHIENGDRWFSPVMTAAHDNSNGFNSPSSFNRSASTYDPEGFWDTCPMFFNQSQAAVVWDSVREVVWYKSAMISQAGGIMSLDPKTKSWSSVYGNSVYGLSTEVIAACDPDRGIFLCYDSNGALIGFDIETPTGTTEVISTIGTPCPADGAGMAYDPVGKRFLLWGGSGATVYTLTPAASWKTGTWTWGTLVNAGGSATPTSAPIQGTYGRFNYISSLHALCLVNSTTEQMYVYKLPVT